MKRLTKPKGRPPTKKPLTFEDVKEAITAPINKDYKKKKEKGSNSNFNKVYKQVES